MNALGFIVLSVAMLLLLIWGGGIFPGALCVAVALLCGAAVVVVLRRRRDAAPAQPAPFPAFELALLVLLVFIGFTALPLPPAAQALIGTERQTQNGQVVSALHDLSAIGLNGDTSPWFALTRNRAGTWRMLLLVCAALGAGLLTASLSRPWRLAWLGGVSAMGVAVAIAGNVGQWWLKQGDTLWWLFPVPHLLPGPVGCFINRNHFGGFLALLVPAVLGFSAWAWLSRRWIIALTTTLGVLAMVAALVMSLSRGSLVALGGALALTALLTIFRHRPRHGLGVLAVVVVIAVAVFHVPHPAVRARLNSLLHPATDTSVQSRLAEWRETLRVWPHYPVIGAGANALRMVYPQVRQTASGRWLVNAENEYLQVLTEGGLVGVVLSVALLAFAAQDARRGVPVLPEVCRWGIEGSLFTAALHACWDFPLHVPVYAAVAASLAGTLMPPLARTGLARALMVALAGLALTAAAVLGFSRPDDLRRLDAHEELQAASLPDLRRALVWAPTSWHAWYYLGLAVSRDGILHGDVRRCFLGERLMSQAAACDPNNYRLWYEVGRARLALRDYDGAEAAFARAKTLRPWLSPPPIDRPGGKR